MLKFLLILLLFCLLAGYVGYRVLRFLTRIVETVSGIHDEGQRRPGGPGQDPRESYSEAFSNRYQSAGRPGGPGGEKDITERARIIEEKPGGDG